MVDKTVVVVCSWRNTETPTGRALRAAASSGRYEVLDHWNDALIDRARSVAATRFLREYAAPELFFVDSDIVFTVEDLDRVVALSRKKGTIAGAGYPVRREEDPWPAVRPLDGRAARFGPGAPPERVRYLSGGFLAIPRHVLRAVADTLPLCIGSSAGSYWPMFLPMVIEKPNGLHEELPEDWSFCHRAGELGFDVWLDGAVELGHLGVYEYRLGQLISRDDCAAERNAVLQDLSLYWEMDAPTLLQRLDGGKSRRVLAEEWRRSDPHTVDEVQSFYQRQDEYIADLALFNVQVDYWRTVKPLLVVRGKVVDFGGGIGSLALALARRGCDVTYVDLPSPQRNFAEWRFARHGFPVAVAASLDGLHDLDAIVSSDVIEHLHPDALPQVAQQMAAALKSGGEARTINKFSKSDTWPMHYDSEAAWKEAMNAAGFKGGPVLWVKQT